MALGVFDGQLPIVLMALFGDIATLLANLWVALPPKLRMCLRSTVMTMGRGIVIVNCIV